MIFELPFSQIGGSSSRAQSQPSKNKKELRSDAKRVLKSLPLKLLSAEANAHLGSFKLLQEAKNILYYWPLNDELSLLPSLQESLSAGKKCFLPKVLTEGNLLAISSINSLDQNLIKSFYGSLESNLRISKDLSELDFVFVPGLAFDKQGYRLGRGLGFYDRLLAGLSAKAIKVGVIPNKLLLEHLPCPLESWDMPVDYLLTEAGLKPAS